MELLESAPAEALPAAPGNTARAFFYGFAAAFLTKVPFLAGAYGTDYDNFLVVQAAKQIKVDSLYYASRFPGNPLQEYSYSWLPHIEPWLVHLVTALLSGVAAGAFAILAQRWRVRHPYWLTAAFVLLPAFFVNGFTALDYNWALSFCLLSALAADSKRPALAGALLGLSAGCRLATLFIGLPLIILFREPGKCSVALRNALLFVLLAVAVTAACFYPAYRAYGTGFFTFYAQPLINPVKVAYKATSEVWGEIGFVALLFIGLQSLWPRSHRVVSAVRGNRTLLAIVVIIAINLLVFLRAPFEGEYLLPAATLLLLCLGRLMSVRQVQVLSLAFALSLFVGIAKDMTPRGKLLEELEERAEIQSYVEHIVASRAQRPEGAIVITSFYQPLIELALDAPYATSIEHRGRFPMGYARFYRVLPKQMFLQFKEEGRPIYVVADPSPGDIHGIGYDPAGLGAIVIPKP